MFLSAVVERVVNFPFGCICGHGRTHHRKGSRVQEKMQHNMGLCCTIWQGERGGGGFTSLCPGGGWLSGSKNLSRFGETDDNHR